MREKEAPDRLIERFLIDASSMKVVKINNTRKRACVRSVPAREKKNAGTEQDSFVETQRARNGSINGTTNHKKGRLTTLVFLLTVAWAGVTNRHKGDD